MSYKPYAKLVEAVVEKFFRAVEYPNTHTRIQQGNKKPDLADKIEMLEKQKRLAKGGNFWLEAFQIYFDYDVKNKIIIRAQKKIDRLKNEKEKS